MFGFNKKNNLKRTDLMRLIDIEKIRAQKMSIEEIKNMFNTMEEDLSKHYFDTDKNYIFNSRRKAVKSEMERFLMKSDNTNEFLYYALHNFWEFISDEYPGNPMETCRELGISIQEFDRMDMTYRKKGIICVQEKDTILEMIQTIKNHIDKGLK